MLKITHCGDRALLYSNTSPAVVLHMSKKELVNVVKSGMLTLTRLASKKPRKPCKWCR